MRAVNFLRVANFLFLAACAPPGGILLSPTPPIYDATQAAAFAMNEAIGTELILLGTGGLHVTPGEQTCGFYDGLIIEVARECATLSPDATECVIVHEVGHALGLGHSQDITSVMYPVFQEGRTLKYCAESMAQELSTKRSGP